MTNQIAAQSNEPRDEDDAVAGEFVADGQLPMIEKFSKHNLEVVIGDEMEISVQGEFRERALHRR